MQWGRWWCHLLRMRTLLGELNGQARREWERTELSLKCILGKQVKILNGVGSCFMNLGSKSGLEEIFWIFYMPMVFKTKALGKWEWIFRRGEVPELSLESLQYLEVKGKERNQQRKTPIEGKGKPEAYKVTEAKRREDFRKESSTVPNSARSNSFKKHQIIEFCSMEAIWNLGNWGLGALLRWKLIGAYRRRDCKVSANSNNRQCFQDFPYKSDQGNNGNDNIFY